MPLPDTEKGRDLEMVLKGLRVLVVDDETDLSEILVEFLSSQGAILRSASGGQEAFAIFLTFRPDVLLSDIRMPNGDGIELLWKVLATDSIPRPICLMMSGYSEASERELLELGAHGLLQKPFPMDEILVRLQEMLGTRARDL